MEALEVHFLYIFLRTCMKSRKCLGVIAMTRWPRRAQRRLTVWSVVWT